MMTLPHDLEEQLRRIADREKRSPEEVLRALLSHYEDAEDAPTLALLANTLAGAEYHSGQSSNATQSREILGNEYADYLSRRMSRRDDGSN